MHKKTDDNIGPVGIFSYQGNAGVTHLALMTASYFSSKKGRNVWYLELGNQYTIERMVTTVNGRYMGKNGEFIADRIRFFPNVSVEKALELLKKAPEVVIIDFGKMTPDKIRVLILCEKRILVSNLSLWKQEEFLDIVTEKIKGPGKLWTRHVCFFGKGNIRLVSKRIKEKIEGLREADVPFYLKKEQADQILKLLR